MILKILLASYGTFMMVFTLAKKIRNFIMILRRFSLLKLNFFEEIFIYDSFLNDASNRFSWNPLSFEMSLVKGLRKYSSTNTFNRYYPSVLWKWKIWGNLDFFHCLMAQECVDFGFILLKSRKHIFWSNLSL